jgi:hypothetical protein
LRRGGLDEISPGESRSVRWIGAKRGEEQRICGLRNNS